jgi:hypothetical protein
VGPSRRRAAAGPATDQEAELVAGDTATDLVTTATGYDATSVDGRWAAADHTISRRGIGPAPSGRRTGPSGHP